MRRTDAPNTLEIDARWEAVLERDPAVDGEFVYAVSSTGIYCRPSCPARRPARDRVLFFDDPDEAEEAGFRECRRCRPRSVRQDVALAERVTAIIDAWEEGAPTLADLSERTGVSPYHLQRTFKRVTGVSPAAYARTRRMGRFRQGLREGADVTTSMYDAGFESSSQLYSTIDQELGMTPASYRAGGAGVCLHYATTESPLGHLLVATTERGVAAILFAEGEEEAIAALKNEFPNARLEPNPTETASLGDILCYLDGRLPHPELPLDIQATAFQRAVWEALRSIPPGETRSYREVAEAIGRPEAARAVAQACASNRLAMAIPCHRVVKADGSPGGYRWGAERKRSLLELERRVAGAAGAEI
ncbi:MAG TPA: bifunctional DNA-binding transcriptional regulator/O6-methylguanine-DNA methyltransferase Ada [Thermomicrobiales bacterium]|nr:bifunctional DNA-binding transcriptional regulator/O6-methylguanine-DNA methyltransferase Ada [Thermomicrobiales bacterium]